MNTHIDTRGGARLDYLRRVTESDEDTLHDIYASTRATEELTLPEPIRATQYLRIQHIAQETTYRTEHPDLERFIVVHRGMVAGRLYVARDEGAISLVEVTLLPEYRNLGIGSRILDDLQDDATQTGRRVVVRVPRPNGRAAGIFERRGYVRVDGDDEVAVYAWEPEG